jgi:hypothetical protein
MAPLICAPRIRPLDCVRISARPFLNMTKGKHFYTFRSTKLKVQIFIANGDSVLLGEGPSDTLDPLGCHPCLPVVTVMAFVTRTTSFWGSFAGSQKFVNPKLWCPPQNFLTRNFGTLQAKQTTCVFFGFTPTRRSVTTKNAIKVPIRICQCLIKLVKPTNHISARRHST